MKTFNNQNIFFNYIIILSVLKEVQLKGDIAVLLNVKQKCPRRNFHEVNVINIKEICFEN